MTFPYTRADSIREYLTGASSDGALQDNPDLSLGNHRSAIEAQSLAIRFTGALQGIQILYVSGANPTGLGALVSLDGVSLSWLPPKGSVRGPRVDFTQGQSKTLIMEGKVPGQYIRLIGTPPFYIGASFIELRTLLGNVFGFNLVNDAHAFAGINQYRATIIKNVSAADVTLFTRWLNELGTSQVSDQQQLGASGSGVIQTSGSFEDWPTTGWCQIRSSGVLQEVVYYYSRTVNQLNVASSGRGLLGTSAIAGMSTDVVHAVPGLATAFDVAGVQNAGSAIATIANDTTAPAGVTWNLGITKADGLEVIRLGPGQQIGIWMWRQIPAGAVYCPNVYNELNSDFFAY